MLIARWLVAAAAILASLAAAVVLTVGSHQPAVGNQSLASGTAACAALSLAVIAGWLALAPTVVWFRLRDAAAAWSAAPAAEAPASRWASWAIVVAVLIHVGCWRWLARANPGPRDDQADYLRVAREVAAAGGPRSLPFDLYAGRHQEDNRHPLYVAMLALRPTFEFGLTLSFVAGLATLAAIAFVERGVTNATALALLLLAGNRSFLESATLVACETWLTLAVLLAWTLLRHRADETTAGQAWLGATFALAYLMKASAFFLFLVVLALAWRRPTGWLIRARGFLAMLAAFTVVASPLLVRNVRVFGQPLHSFNNKLLFADSYAEGIANPDLGLVGNARRYADSHSVGAIADRLLRGLAMECFVMLRSLGPLPLDSGRAVIGLALTLAALAELARDPRGVRADWLLPSTLIFWLFFGWYQPIASGDRFVLPLVPIWLWLAARGLARTVFWIGAVRAPNLSVSRRRHLPDPHGSHTTSPKAEFTRSRRSAR